MKNNISKIQGEKECNNGHFPSAQHDNGREMEDDENPGPFQSLRTCIIICGFRVKYWMLAQKHIIQSS